MRFRIKNLGAILLAFSFIFFTLTGCEDNKPVPREIKGLFLKVEKDGRTSYLGGSIHVSKDYLTFMDKVEEAYKQSDRIAVEIDVTDSEVSKEIMKDSVYSDGDSLSNHISNETKEYILPILKELKIDYDKINNIKPWILSSQISALQLQTTGYYSGRGIDMTFLNKAKNDKKEIYSIETIDEQLKALYFDKSDEFGNEILKSCTDIKESQEVIESMSEALFSGNLEEVEKINLEYEEKSGILNEWTNYVLDERNYKMAERIDKLFKEDKTTFVIIGAGHLVGEKGVIKLLEQYGYKCTLLQ